MGARPHGSRHAPFELCVHTSALDSSVAIYASHLRDIFTFVLSCPRRSTSVKFEVTALIGYIYGDRATGKEGVVVRNGSNSNSRVGVTLRDDAAPLAHPFSKGASACPTANGKDRRVRFMILTVQG